MTRILVTYWLLFITSVVFCVKKPELVRPLIRLLSLLYSLMMCFMLLFGLWLWLFPPFWKGITSAFLALAAGVLCLFAIQKLRHIYLASLLWFAAGVIAFLAAHLISLKIVFSLLISLPPIFLAGFSLASFITKNY